MRALIKARKPAIPPMKKSPRPLHVFQYNPPLRVLSQSAETEDYLFARPTLKRNIAHERVSRYFLKSQKPIQSRLD